MKFAIGAAAALLAVVAALLWRSAGVTDAALPLHLVADVPLSGSATRFDYLSMDRDRGVMWLAHMGDGSVEAFDVEQNRVTLTVPIRPDARVRGVLAVRGRVYAAAQGMASVVVLDATDGRRVATIPAGDVDGLADDPVSGRVFVSDEAGGRDVAIDTHRARVAGAVALGGEAGNTQYDPVSHRILVGVQTRDELAAIDPATLRVVRRSPLAGCRFSHSVAIDPAARAAFVGCQGNARVVRLDLRTGRVTASGGVGIGVDVLALDAALHRLYVGSESGVVSVYDVADGRLARIAQAFLALHAHALAVDPATHRLYVPLESVGGRPMMRVYAP